MTEELTAFAASLLLELCAEHPLGYTPALVWRRLRVTAGMAHFHQKSISLSSLVLTDESKISVTLRHEYAHLLAFARHGAGGRGHGVAWRQAMMELGLEPTIHHNYEVQRNKPRQRVTYQCQRCGKLLDRARKLPSRRRYVHANCGGPLKLKGVVANAQ